MIKLLLVSLQGVNHALEKGQDPGLRYLEKWNLPELRGCIDRNKRQKQETHIHTKRENKHPVKEK